MKSVFHAGLSAATALSATLFAAATLAQDSNRAENITIKDGSAKAERTLKSDDGKDRVRQQPCKVFTVEFESGRNYKIDMTSKEIDSYLRLEDPAGKELAKDDDSGGLLNAHIGFHCRTAGAYRIVCTTFGGGTGPFTLRIQQFSIPKAAELSLKEGQAAIESELVDKDATDAVRTRSACKTFAIRMEKGKSYKIEMKSKDVDSYLRLEDSAGNELTKDDDSGGNRDARIQFACPDTGEYRIVATTFHGGKGHFALTVKERP